MSGRDGTQTTESLPDELVLSSKVLSLGIIDVLHTTTQTPKQCQDLTTDS